MKVLNIQDQSFISDEYGRLVTDNKELLQSLSGAFTQAPEFMPPDVACGNGNCAC